jgi:hypothetical protein
MFGQVGTRPLLSEEQCRLDGGNGSGRRGGYPAPSRRQRQGSDATRRSTLAESGPRSPPNAEGAPIQWRALSFIPAYGNAAASGGARSSHLDPES